MDGESSRAGLVQGTDGAFYGTTTNGGAANVGTVFKISADGSSFSLLHSFDYTSGSYPYAGLVQGTDGAFYGMASAAGPQDGGVIFRLSADAPTVVTTLKINGQHPTPPTVTVTGPTLLTLDVSPGTYRAPVDWYWALYYNGTLYWVTSVGFSTTPAPWFQAPPVTLTNVTLLHFTLPPASSITNIVFMVNGTTTVSLDYITATRP